MHPGILLLRAVSIPKQQQSQDRKQYSRNSIRLEEVSEAAHFLQAIGSSWLLSPASEVSASARACAASATSSSFTVAA